MDENVRLQVVDAVTSWLEISQSKVLAETSAQCERLRTEVLSHAENFSRAGLTEIQQLFSTRLGQLEGQACEVLSLCEKLVGFQARLEETPVVAMSDPDPRLVEIPKIQAEIKLLMTLHRDLKNGLSELGQVVPTLGYLKKEVEALISKARVKVARDLSAGESQNREQNLKVWEALTKSQEEKLEARLQSLEKINKAENLAMSKRIDSLSRENDRLRAELQKISRTPAPQPQVIVNSPPAPPPVVSPPPFLWNPPGQPTLFRPKFG